MKIYVAKLDDDDSIEIFPNAIKDIDPNDIVHVVRCKDCRWYAGKGNYCTNNMLTQFDHFFCYYGERKEDDGEIN